MQESAESKSCLLIRVGRIITIGASCTALYRILFRMRRKERVYIIRDFWAVFKEEWNQSTALWAMTTSYMFAVEARFANTSVNQIKNAFRMA